MIKKVSIGITIILILLMTGFGFMMRKQDAAKSQKMAEVNKQSETYEKEIAELKQSLKDRQRAVTAVSKDYGSICLAVKVSTFDELVWITEWVKPYDYPICVILTSDMIEDDQERIFNSLIRHTEWSFMMEGEKSQWIDRTADIYKELTDKNLVDSGFIYFENEATEEQLEVLGKSGWRGYSNPIESMSGSYDIMSDTELSQIGHVMLTEDNALRAVIEDSIVNGSLFILSVDMEMLNRTFTRESVERILDKIEEDYIETRDLQKTSLNVYLEEFEAGKEARMKRQAEYEKYEEKCQKQIQELEDKIIRMYEDLK